MNAKDIGRYGLLLVLSAVAVVAVGAALVTAVMRPSAPAEDVGPPRVAILSTDQLDTVQSQLSADLRDARSMDEISAAFALEIVQAGDSEAAADGAGDGQSGGVRLALGLNRDDGVNATRQEVLRQQQARLEVLIGSARNQLEGRVTRQLIDSQRFRVADPLQVQDVLFDYLEPEPTVEDAGERNGDGGLLGPVTDFFRGAGGRAPLVRLSDPDFNKALEELDVGYVLILGVSEPQFRLVRDTAAYSSREEVYLRMQPIFTYRLYDVDGKSVVAANVARLDRPIRVRLRDVNPQSSEAQIRDALSEAVATMEFDAYSPLARSVVSDIIERVAPARIVNIAEDGRLLTIDRGANDAVRAGDRFRVYRLADIGGPRNAPDDRDGSLIDGPRARVSEAPRTLIGVLEVDDVQRTIASGRLISSTGATVQVGDSVERMGGGAGAAAGGVDGARSSAAGRAPAAAPSRAKPALGAAAIQAEQRGETNDARPRIAVSRVSISFDADAFPEDETGMPSEAFREKVAEAFRRGMTERLSADVRLVVVDRIDLEALRDERRFTDEAQGRVERDRYEGMTGADYVIRSDANLALEVTQRMARVGGESRVVETRYDLGVRGSVSAIDPDTSQRAPGVPDAPFESVIRVPSIRAAGEDEFLLPLARDAASRAVAALIGRLFPVQVIRADGDVVYLSGGEAAGLQVGVRVQTFSLSEPLIDPATGLELAAGARTPAAVLEVTDVQPTSATARYVSRGGPALKTGDQAEVSDLARARPQASVAIDAAPDAGPVEERADDEDPKVPF